jgi:hypothetical protein
MFQILYQWSTNIWACFTRCELEHDLSISYFVLWDRKKGDTYVAVKDAPSSRVKYKLNSICLKMTHM